MYFLIESELSNGHNVVHDTGNFTAAERSLVSGIATKLNLDFITVYVDTPVNTAFERLQQNRQSPTRFNIADDQFHMPLKKWSHQLLPNI